MNNTKNTTLIGILVLSLVANFFFMFQTNEKDVAPEKPIIYNFDTTTENLNIKDLTLVRFNNQIYIQKGYIFEKKETATKLDNIQLSLDIAGKHIYDISQGDVFSKSNEFAVPNFILISNVKFTKSPKLVITIKYTENNVKKEFSDTIDLNSHIAKD